MLDVKKTFTKICEALSGMLNSVSTVSTSTAVSTTNNTDTTLCNTGSLDPGTYILKGIANFDSNATGHRRLFFATSDSGSAVDRFARVYAAAASDSATIVQVEYMATITSATTFYLRARQTSGGTLSVDQGGIQVIKLHA